MSLDPQERLGDPGEVLLRPAGGVSVTVVMVIRSIPTWDGVKAAAPSVE